jgi:hypothetical protein
LERRYPKGIREHETIKGIGCNQQKGYTIRKKTSWEQMNLQRKKGGKYRITLVVLEFSQVTGIDFKTIS